MTNGPNAPVKNLFSRSVAALAAMVIAIVSLLGALMAAPEATAAPVLTSLITLLQAPEPPEAASDFPEAQIAAAFSDLDPQLTSTINTDADIGYLSDLQTVGIPAEVGTPLAQNAIEVAHLIVDRLHANPTFSEVNRIFEIGLKNGFTHRQVAGLIVFAAKWYGPDLLPLLKAYGESGA